MPSINPVFYREMLLLKKKALRLGYLFSTLLFPLLYLFAFGWGLGSKVRLDGTSYVVFLVPGLLAMTAMNNSFNLSAGSVGMGRLYSRTIQPILTSPVGAYRVVNGYLMAGIVRGIIGSGIVAFAAFLLFGSQVINLSAPAVAGLTLTMAFFSLLGLIVGLLIKDLEDIAVITNFVIMPMAFFSGTFFPLETVPVWLRSLLTLLPLSQVNLLMRSHTFTTPALTAVACLTLFTVGAYAVSAYYLTRFQE